MGKTTNEMELTETIREMVVHGAEHISFEE